MTRFDWQSIWTNERLSVLSYHVSIRIFLRLAIITNCGVQRLSICTFQGFTIRSQHRSIWLNASYTRATRSIRIGADRFSIRSLKRSAIRTDEITFSISDWFSVFTDSSTIWFTVGIFGWGTVRIEYLTVGFSIRSCSCFKRFAITTSNWFPVGSKNATILVIFRGTFRSHSCFWCRATVTSNQRFTVVVIYCSIRSDVRTCTWSERFSSLVSHWLSSRIQKVTFLINKGLSFRSNVSFLGLSIRPNQRLSTLVEGSSIRTNSWSIRSTSKLDRIAVRSNKWGTIRTDKVVVFVGDGLPITTEGSLQWLTVFSTQWCS